MTGIELLLMIKEEMIEDGTEIYVFKEVKDRISEFITVIMFIDTELKWAPGTFRSSMLWSDRFYFEIAENEAFPDKIEKLDTTGNWNFDILKNKINELIDIVNEIQNKDQ